MVQLTDPERLRSELNEPQWDAVAHVHGPLLILAGAGSGKTRVLAYRIAYLVASAGVDPRSILAVTFTNKAAGEMRRRVEALLGSRAGGIWIGTFHGICLRILRAHPGLLPVGPGFTIYDSDDQVRAAEAVVAEMGLDPKRWKPAALLHSMQRAKDEARTPDELRVPGPRPHRDTLADFYARYQARLRQANAMDFGDLLFETLRLFRDHPDLADHYRRRFAQILIDEYQDTNRVQYLLAREIARGHGNLCVVGDDDQSIYRWRGADLRNILSFEEDFPGARVIKLEQNYRSTQAILDAASSVVDRNRARRDKNLWTERKAGEPVLVHEAPTEEEEAAWVADTVQKLRAQGLRYSDLAVLYRVHALSRPFEEAFLRRRIPYVVYGGLRFYDRKEIKDALSWLRFVVNPDDLIAFRRIVASPPRGIGKATVEAVEHLARERGFGLWKALEVSAEEGVLPTRAARAVSAFASLVRGWRETLGTAPLREFLALILEESGTVGALKAENDDPSKERLENLGELLNAAESFEVHEQGDARAFLDRAALVTDQDLGPDRADVVTLMTLHAAKGLEYTVIFLAGLEEGVFPHHRSSEKEDEIEEERRLCYVGITRAKDRLYLTRSRIRRVYGSEGYLRLPSRFLQELPAGVYRPAPERFEFGFDARREGPPDTGRYLAPEPGEAAYAPGMKVRHPSHGVGNVVAVEGKGLGAKVTVRFADGTRKFLSSLASLEVAIED